METYKIFDQKYYHGIKKYRIKFVRTCKKTNKETGDKESIRYSFTDIDTKLKVHINVKSELIKYAPHFKGSGEFIIGCDKNFVPFYIIKNTLVWFVIEGNIYKQCLETFAIIRLNWSEDELKQNRKLKKDIYNKKK